MKLCVPVLSDQGIDSPVSSHFGSAPFYVLVDGATGHVRAVPNGRTAHEHGACRPLDSLAGEEVDVVLVGGIGAGAIAKLQAAGIRVVRAGGRTVRECVAALSRGDAVELQAVDACASHGHSHDHVGSEVVAPMLPTRR